MHRVGRRQRSVSPSCSGLPLWRLVPLSSDGSQTPLQRGFPHRILSGGCVAEPHGMALIEAEVGKWCCVCQALQDSVTEAHVQIVKTRADL